MASEWATVELRELVEMSTDKIETNCIPDKCYVSTDSMLPDFGGVSFNGATPSVVKTSSFSIDDILFSNIRTYFRKLWIADRNGGCSNDVIVFRPKKHVHPRFMFYSLMDERFIQHTVQTSKGTKMPRGDKSAMLQYRANLPPLPEQKAIAHILGSLDDKIELNQRMNETLEGMAQALFKSWFVDFDPVIDNALEAGNPIPAAFAARAETRKKVPDLGKTAVEFSNVRKLFPDSFQPSELGPIPTGWEVKSFDTLAKLDTTSVKPFQQPETEWEHYSIPSYDSSGMPSLDKGGEIKSNKYQVKPGAILSSKLNPETERTWWPFMMNEKASICSTEFMQFVPHQVEEQAFIYSLIRSDPFQANILERVTGSTGSRQRAQPKQIADIGIIDCGEALRAEYIKVALPLFQSTRNNSIQSQSLAKLRDTLLPKLISGELRVESLNGEG